MGIANTNLLPSQHVAIAGAIDPDAYNAGSQSTGWVSMADFEAVMAVVMAGDLGTDATLDAKLQQATDSSGTGAKDIPGKAITQLTQADDGSNQQAIINCYADELDVENGFTHVRLTVTIAEAASDAGALLFGLYPHYGPADKHNADSVAEIVS